MLALLGEKKGLVACFASRNKDFEAIGWLLVVFVLTGGLFLGYVLDVGWSVLTA